MSEISQWICGACGGVHGWVCPYFGGPAGSIHRRIATQKVSAADRAAKVAAFVHLRKRDPKSLCSVCGQSATIYPPIGDDSPTYCEAHCPTNTNTSAARVGVASPCFAEPPLDFFEESDIRSGGWET